MFKPRTTDVSKIGSFDPNDSNSGSIGPNATQYETGTVVTGDLDAAVPRATQAMPTPIKKSKG